MVRKFSKVNSIILNVENGTIIIPSPEGVMLTSGVKSEDKSSPYIEGRPENKKFYIEGYYNGSPFEGESDPLILIEIPDIE